MPEWSTEEQLRFDVAYALTKVPLPGFRRGLTEADRATIARVIVEHLLLCWWRFDRTPAKPQ